MEKETDSSNSPAISMQIIIGSLLILLLLGYAYKDTFHYPFHFDDESTIVKDDDIRDVTDIPTIWQRNPARFFAFYSFAVNYHFGKLDTFGYHVFNFTVQCINALVAIFFAMTILETGPGRKLTEKFEYARWLFPLMVSAPFALHPLQTQAVTYIWQRNTSMAAMFYLLSLTLYLRSQIAEQKEGDGNTKNLLILSIIFGVMACFTKQFSVTLAVVIFIADYYFISGTVQKMKERITTLALYLPVMMIVPALTAADKNEELKHIGARFEYVLSPIEYLYTQCNVIVTTYLRLIFWPTGQVHDYDITPALHFSDAWVTFTILCLLLGFGIWLFRYNRIASFGIMFFFVTMSVESSFFPLEDRAFEHRVYLPSIGIYITVVSFLIHLAGKLGKKRAVAFLLSFFLITSTALAEASLRRNFVWSDPLVLWKDVAKKMPHKTRAFLNVGVAYERKGDLENAELWFRKALAIKPDSNFALFHIGNIYLSRGMKDKAIKTWLDALKINPAAKVVHYALGNTYMDKKNYIQAAKHFRVALSLEGWRNREGLMALGTALTYGGALAKAIEVYKIVLRVEPNNKTALNNVKVLSDALKKQ